MEGVAFGLRDCFELIGSVDPSLVEQVRISGGGAQSTLWKNIIANVINTRIFSVNTTEGAAYGAALLAGVGAEIWKDVMIACKETINTFDEVLPQKEDVEKYRKIYPIYRQIYPSLKKIFALL